MGPWPSTMRLWQADADLAGWKRTAVPMTARDLIMYVVVLDIDNYPLLGQVSAYVSSGEVLKIFYRLGTRAISSGNSIWVLPCALIVLYCTALYKLREARQLRCYGMYNRKPYELSSCLELCLPILAVAAYVRYFLLCYLSVIDFSAYTRLH